MDVINVFVIGFSPGMMLSSSSSYAFSSSSSGSFPTMHFLRVLGMPCLGLFILPFAVAGDGAKSKCFLIVSAFMCGMPSSCPFSTALIRVEIGGLKKH